MAVCHTISDKSPLGPSVTHCISCISDMSPIGMSPAMPSLMMTLSSLSRKLGGVAVVGAALGWAGLAQADGLPSVEQARASAVTEMADVLSEGIWSQDDAGRIAETRVAVSRPMPYRLALVWTELNATAGEWGQDVCWAERVATPAGSAWVGICLQYTE